jgi:pantothenate kinase
MQNPDMPYPTTLVVTEQIIDISGFTDKQKSFYSNLFWKTVGVFNDSKKSRVIIGIAGPTGAGKSVVAVLFKELAKHASLPFAFESITIDAYHYPNSFLYSHFSEGTPLKQVKGRFDTYDVQALVKDLQAFAAGENVSFPAYSRKLHDPVKNSTRIGEKATLLVVEGLWLLSEMGEWNNVGPLLDYCYFIDSDKDRTRQAVVRRHVTGGRTLEDAAKYYDEVDGKNSDLTLQTKHHADEVIPPYYLI